MKQAATSPLSQRERGRGEGTLPGLMAAALTLAILTTPAKADPAITVIDGDTIRFARHLSTPATLRFCGIDAPETHEPACKAEEYSGHAAALRLRALIASATTITITIGCNTPRADGQPQHRRKDRYGRWLGELLLDGQSAGARLAAEGLALPYAAGMAAKIERQQHWCGGK